MKNLSAADVNDWLRRARRGDPMARNFLSSLFTAAEPCLLCDKPVGSMGTLAIFPDPQMRGMAIVAAECTGCASRPDRRQREIAMLTAIWPGKKWRARRDDQPKYLRGSPVKKRFAKMLTDWIRCAIGSCQRHRACMYTPCRASQTTRTRRILARVEQPEFEAPELDWINSRTGILGEHFVMASRSIQNLIDTGAMIIVREEAISDE